MVTDTTFVIKEEQLFKTAFKELKEGNFESEKNQIDKKISALKIEKVSKNKKELIPVLQDEIIRRYYYKEGVYQYHLRKDQTLLKGSELLNNPAEYQKILSGN